MLIMTRKDHCVLLLLSVGGAISNMYAMLIARFKMFPEVKEKGMAAVPRLIAFTSEHVRVSVLSKFKVIVCKAQVEGVLMEMLYPQRVDTSWERMRGEQLSGTMG